MYKTIGVIFLLAAHTLCAQTVNTISGYVKDAKTGEDLIGATVSINETSTGVNTNTYGFYSLSLPQGDYRITANYLGYAAQTMDINLTNNQSINFKLEEQVVQMNEVEITGERADHHVSNVQMSAHRINVEEAKKLPALLGEVDIIKIVQAQPGVLSIGEGNSSFFVRGGSGDQNLILIDEAPIYDPSHVFGLFSIFNADVVKDVTLYKGGIPSRFGGRLSSVLDVHTKDGNSEKFSGTGGVSILSGRLMLEGPTVKNKGSFIVSGRTSLLSAFVLGSPKTSRPSYYDLNAKLNWKSSNKNRFFLALYLGRDKMGIGENANFGWGNMTGTFRWNHVFNDKLFFNTSLIGSKFDYDLTIREPIRFYWESYVSQFSIHNDLSYYLSPTTELTMGYHLSYRYFFPGKVKPAGDNSFFSEVQLNDERALEHAFYAEAHQGFGKKWDVRAGLRLSIFQCIGKAAVFLYEDPQNNLKVVRKDVLQFSHFQKIKTYTNPEPRFSVRYNLTETSSAKISYNRMVQNTHLISNGIAPMPHNTWAPSGYYLAPQLADEYAVGYFKNLKNNKYELSGEIYYKDMKNVTEFADNANVLFNTNIATEYRQGKSTGYGLELFAQKKTGAVTGSLSYTWSKSMRTIPGVNDGETFFSSHDRRHAVNFSAAYQLSENWTLGGNFTYGTGRPITLPIGSYTFDNQNVNQASARNGFLLPDFHRLDFSATHTSKKSKKRKWKDQWVYSIYNVYNRKNPFTVAITNKSGTGEKTAEMTYLFPFLPQITYNFKF